ncbi:DNA/RNA non-specific endonuclease [Periweissella beninensis]|uniref:DNA/RNA non-specific endonuclease n=1 Tax=Periweissella beninensis TaxID=504936 RepID=UPI0021A411F4|nr:DNA/RNA non-specific endonuclease [Periweissella beninensis]MCT4395847.1 DNA-entry nuclease [Periweissella beninensis]
MSKRGKEKNQLYIIILILGLLITGGKSLLSNQGTNNQERETTVDRKQTSVKTATKTNAQLANLKYNGQQIVQINQGKPTFKANQLKTTNGPWVVYGELDNLNRATVATGLLNASLMPTVKRQRLTVTPTGYRNRRVPMNGHYDWLFNRAHLIGYQFTGENNNLHNLVTGTRSLNDPAMTYYENRTANYLRTHRNDYVRYEVTPIYRKNELVPRGVHMQAQSIKNATIKYNVYIFNVQKGITINYNNGNSTIN